MLEVHLKLQQSGENVPHLWLFWTREPPAQGKIWPWLLPDEGGVSCHYAGPWVRLMNGGFYLETARELQWRKECQVGNEERPWRLANVGRIFQKLLSWLSTHMVYMYMVSLQEINTRQHRQQHLQVTEKLNQRQPCSHRRETKEPPWHYTHIIQTFPELPQIIICLFTQ